MGGVDTRSGYVWYVPVISSHKTMLILVRYRSFIVHYKNFNLRTDEIKHFLIELNWIGYDQFQIFDRNFYWNKNVKTVSWTAYRKKNLLLLLLSTNVLMILALEKTFVQHLFLAFSLKGRQEREDWQDRKTDRTDKVSLHDYVWLKMAMN